MIYYLKGLFLHLNLSVIEIGRIISLANAREPLAVNSLIVTGDKIGTKN